MPPSSRSIGTANNLRRSKVSPDHSGSFFVIDTGVFVLQQRVKKYLRRLLESHAMLCKIPGCFSSFQTKSKPRN